MGITAHCLVKNEEVFVGYAIRSVIDWVDMVMVYDTGSTDETVAIVQALVAEYPKKIFFTEKGPCDKKQHTALRSEMLAKTTTEWFLILDGDEVWTKRGVEEAKQLMEAERRVECIMAPFYLCVGDIYHRYYKHGAIEMLGKKDFFYPRIIRKVEGLHWDGDYNADALYGAEGKLFFHGQNSAIMRTRFWHLTHLRRSSHDDGDYSSGGTRRAKRKLTYTYIGRAIKEPVPEVFGMDTRFRLSFVRSCINLFRLCFGQS